jgi:hypothetical protein
VAHARRQVLLGRFRVRGTGHAHVGEHHARPAEHEVLELDARVDRDVVLHLDAASEAHAGGDEYVLSEAAAGADLGAGADMTEVPDARARADARAHVDDGGRMGKKVDHDAL